MSSQSSTKSTAKTYIHTDIIETHILTKLDGPSLASVAATSRLLNGLCSKEKVWSDLCSSIWPSTKHSVVCANISTCDGGYRSFFSDSYRILDHNGNTKFQHLRQGGTYNSTELISAVDIHYKDKLLCSKAHVTDTRSNGFLDSIFQVKLFDCDKNWQTIIPAKHEDDDFVFIDDLKQNMTLSWILIDTTLKRVANVSSCQPVSVRRHWDGGNIEVKYATIVGGKDWQAEFRVVVMLEWKGEELQMKSVKLLVMDMDDMCLSGKESLIILQDAIKSRERKKAKRGEETEMYRKFVTMKRNRREAVQMRKKRGVTKLISAGAVFFTFVILVLFTLFVAPLLMH